MSNDFLFSDDDKPKKDVATIPPFGFLATPEGQSQEKTAVIKPSPVPAKKKPNAPPSKRQKRGAVVATSFEVHQPSASSDNVSGTAYARLFWFLSFMILIQLVFYRL
jgi:hypothetical protein